MKFEKKLETKYLKSSNWRFIKLHFWTGMRCLRFGMYIVQCIGLWYLYSTFQTQFYPFVCVIIIKKGQHLHSLSEGAGDKQECSDEHLSAAEGGWHRSYAGQTDKWWRCDSYLLLYLAIFNRHRVSRGNIGRYFRNTDVERQLQILLFKNSRL